MEEQLKVKVNPRNGLIELMRFIAAMMIVMVHFTQFNRGIIKLRIGHGIFEKPLFLGGAIFVEFFFILSGFLMAKTAYRYQNTKTLSRSKETIEFLGRKLKTVAAEYYPAWIGCFILWHFAKERFGVGLWLKDLFKAIPELLFIRQIIPNSKVFMTGSWYLSAMLISMAVIFPILLKDRDSFCRFKAPVIAAVLLLFLVFYTGSLRDPSEMIFKYLYKGLIRGFAEICLGCFCYDAHLTLKRAHISKGMGVFLGIISYLIYIALIWSAAVYKGGKLDILLTAGFAFAITITFSGVCPLDVVFDNNLSYMLGTISFPLYLVNGTIANYIAKLLPKFTGMTLFSVYLAVTFIAAFLILGIGRLLRKI